MLGFLRKFSKSRRQARRSGQMALERMLTQARLPIFYTKGRVADTVTGRFDMIALHAFLVMRALRADGRLAELNQAFLDSLFATIDASFREMGISDPRVPRKMRQAAEAFYGRLGAYEKGLNEGGFEGLKAALRRNLYRNEEPNDQTLDIMARYVIGSLGTLALLTAENWSLGELKYAQVGFGD